MPRRNVHFVGMIEGFCYNRLGTQWHLLDCTLQQVVRYCLVDGRVLVEIFAKLLFLLAVAFPCFFRLSLAAARGLDNEEHSTPCSLDLSRLCKLIFCLCRPGL